MKLKLLDLYCGAGGAADYAPAPTGKIQLRLSEVFGKREVYELYDEAI